MEEKSLDCNRRLQRAAPTSVTPAGDHTVAYLSWGHPGQPQSDGIRVSAKDSIEEARAGCACDLPF